LAPVRLLLQPLKNKLLVILKEVLCIFFSSVLILALKKLTLPDLILNFQFDNMLGV